MITQGTDGKLMFPWLFAGLAYLAAACSSGDFKNEETVAQQRAAIVMCTNNPGASTGASSPLPSPAWANLGGGNFMPYADASNDLVCGVSISSPGQVACFVPSATKGELDYKITNWGGAPPTGAPIWENVTPIAVALAKWTDLPTRAGGAHYTLFVLLSDSTVVNTDGESDHFYEGQNFKSYRFFIPPFTYDGEHLSFKKIVYANEDFGRDPDMEPQALYALTNDNRLFFKAPGSTWWRPFESNVQDMGHMPGHGMTVLYTDGSLSYFSLDFRTWNGRLPNPSGFNIIAVGGTYALTDAGCGGACAANISTFCAGDDDRILHFNWAKWKWERLQDQLAPYAAQYYPMEPVYVCPNCSPQWGLSIVDPHGLGSNAFPSFDLGPFVYWSGGQRVRFYNMKTDLQGELHQCTPQTSGTCSGPCAMQTNGTPCPGNVPSVCYQKVCQACGGEGQRACPALACASGMSPSSNGVCPLLVCQKFSVPNINGTPCACPAQSIYSNGVLRNDVSLTPKTYYCRQG
jgi:hypothetical protein